MCASTDEGKEEEAGVIIAALIPSFQRRSRKGAEEEDGDEEKLKTSRSCREIPIKLFLSLPVFHWINVENSEL